MAAPRSAVSSSRSATFDGRLRMTFGRGDSLRETNDQAEPLVDRGRQSRVCSGIEQRLVQQRDRAAGFLQLDLTHQGQRLSTLRASGGAGQKVASEGARSLHLARREMQARRLVGTAIGVRTVLRRRQTKRVLAELRRDDRRALSVGSLCRLFDRGRKVGVRLVGRERQVTSASDRILDEVGKAAVRMQPLAPRTIPGRGPRQAAGA